MESGCSFILQLQSHEQDPNHCQTVYNKVTESLLQLHSHTGQSCASQLHPMLNECCSRLLINILGGTIRCVIVTGHTYYVQLVCYKRPITAYFTMHNIAAVSQKLHFHFPYYQRLTVRQVVFTIEYLFLPRPVIGQLEGIGLLSSLRPYWLPAIHMKADKFWKSIRTIARFS